MPENKPYENKLRVRAGAIIFDDDTNPNAILLVKYVGFYDEPIWLPAGGGVNFGESLPEALIREVKEETGLDVEVLDLMYTLEFVRPPLHAVSFYFRCRPIGGKLIVGIDPEFETQFIQEVAYIPFDQMSDIRVIPEGLETFLPADLANKINFPKHLGTFR